MGLHREKESVERVISSFHCNIKGSSCETKLFLYCYKWKTLFFFLLCFLNQTLWPLNGEEGKSSTHARHLSERKFALVCINNILNLLYLIQKQRRETRLRYHPVTKVQSLAIVTVCLLLDLLSLGVHVWACGLWLCRPALQCQFEPLRLPLSSAVATTPSLSLAYRIARFRLLL